MPQKKPFVEPQLNEELSLAAGTLSVVVPLCSGQCPS
jgi:hypothetical protein